MTERSVFITALELEDADERSVYLDDACRGDARLRERVNALLRAHDAAAEFMDQPAAVQVLASDEAMDGRSASQVPDRASEQNESRVEASADGEPSEGPGTRIGRYKLLQQIGEGGFGVVYMAEQVEPVKRKVALKIIKPGMDTKEVIARFEAERQALAMMDHPNIARVLDAGTTEDPSGRPYFVMELVNGVPVTEYCDANHATTRERLELFVTVCRAVQHAHQKGIIHRDLKPSNIMVTLHDSRPVPKIIDFGVAKALKQELTARTLFTMYGQMIGTPAYMSPEQAQMSGIDVDTRSDIYAIGVLLYELLTGRTPLDAERLRGTTLAEMQRIIREEDPLRPSERLAELGRVGRVREPHHHNSETSIPKSQTGGARRLDPPYEHESALSAIARQRGTDPQRLRREIAGDLDWIVMKALEKDRTRRYDTANSLARDVERHLRDEPIEAGPPSRLVQWRKFARRHKHAFAVATVIAVLLAVAFTGLAVSNVRIRLEQARTATERDRAEKAQKLAELRADETTQVLEDLKSASDLVDRARVYMDWLHWDEAELALNHAIKLQPKHATAWRERGYLLARLGLWDLAAGDLAKAIELQPPDTSSDWFAHALLRKYVGDVTGYEQACNAMHERFDGTNRRLFAMDLVRACTIGPDTREPAALVELAEAIVSVDPQSPPSLYVPGVAHYRAGEYESAIRRLREASDLDPGWLSRPIVWPILAMAYHRLGRADEARQMLSDAARALDQWTDQRFRGGDPVWVIHQGATAVWPVPWQDWLLCELQYEEARAELDLPAPAPDPRLHVLRARAFAGLRRPDEAVAEFARALELKPDDCEIQLQFHYARGRHHAFRREWARAADEFERAGELLPAESYLPYFQGIARLAGSDLEAYRLVCVTMLERFGGTHDPRAAHAVAELCTLVPDAVPDPTQLLPAALVAASWYPGASRIHGAVLYRAGDYQQAVEVLNAAAKLHRAHAGDLFFLGMAYQRLGDSAAARRCLDEGVAWIEGSDHPGPKDIRGTRPSWGRWDERIVFPILRREAEAIVHGDNANSIRPERH